MFRAGKESAARATGRSLKRRVEIPFPVGTFGGPAPGRSTLSAERITRARFNAIAVLGGMPKARKKSSGLRCRCITLHTYPAFVYHDSWDVMIHICKCGREHINESLIPPPEPRKQKRRT